MKDRTLTLTSTLGARGRGLRGAGSRRAEGAGSARDGAADGWVVYHVPMVPTRASRAAFRCTTARPCVGAAISTATSGISGRGTTTPASRATPGTGLRCICASSAVGSTRVRAIGASCPVHSAGHVREIDPVDPADSVGLLASLPRSRPGTGDDDDGLAAIAYHAEASATDVLAARAGAVAAHGARKQALFWLGQTRGRDGADVVEHYATTDANPTLRAHAVFALSQSDVRRRLRAHPHDRAATIRPSTCAARRCSGWRRWMTTAR